MKEYVLGTGAELFLDGGAATFWQANDNDSNPWWQVDLERAVTMTQDNRARRSVAVALAASKRPGAARKPEPARKRSPAARRKN